MPEQVDDRPALVVDIHGFLNRPSTQQGFSDFEALANDEGFLVAWPYGIRWSWNGGGDPWPSDTELDERPGIGCCGHALNNGLDDVGFIRALIESIDAAHDIDRSRIYVSGFSTGCMLAQRMAAEASDLIAGVACMSGFLLVDASSDYTAVPVAVFNGTDDTIAPYERDYWPGAVANFDTWRELNGCADEPAEVWRDGDHVMLQASDCAAGSRVALITLDGVGHVTYRGHGELDVDTTRMAWRFLGRLAASTVMAAGFDRSVLQSADGQRELEHRRSGGSVRRGAISSGRAPTGLGRRRAQSAIETGWLDGRTRPDPSRTQR